MGIITSDRYLPPLTFASWSKDENIRYCSTSGGVFTELAKVIVSKNGCIAGAKYNSDLMVEHCLTDSIEGIEELRRSKYMSSNLGDIYKEIKTALNEGKKVGFCGSPCQVEGLYCYLGHDYDNLFTFDFICRGMNSPKAFKSWLKEEEEKENSRAKTIWFKYKEGGWKSSPLRTRVDFDDGHNVVYDSEKNLFMYGYLTSNIYIRPCCGTCRFKGIPRHGDITLADFWGIDQKYDDDKGTSMVLINSKKGELLFEETKKNLIYYERNFDEILRGNPMFDQSATVPQDAHGFLKDLDELVFSEALKKYNAHPDQANRYGIFSKVKKVVKRIIRRK